MKKTILATLTFLLAAPLAADWCQNPPTPLDAVACLADVDPEAAARAFADLDVATLGGPSGGPIPGGCPNGPGSAFWQDALLLAMGIVGPGPWRETHPADWDLPAARMECRDDGDTFMWLFWRRALDATAGCAPSAYDDDIPPGFAPRLAEARRLVERWVSCRRPLSVAELVGMDRWRARTAEGEALGIDREAWPDQLVDDRVTADVYRALAAAGDPVEPWDALNASAVVTAYRAERQAGDHRRPESIELSILRRWQGNARPPRPPVLGCPPCVTCPAPCEPPASVPVVVFNVENAQSPPSDRCLETDPPSCAIVPEVVAHDAAELSIRMRITLDELPQVGENVAAFYVKGGRLPSDDALYLILKRTGPSRWKAIGRAGPGKFGGKSKAAEKLTKAPQVGVPFLVELDREADQGVTFRVLAADGELLAGLEIGKKAAPGTFRVFRAELGHKGDQAEHGEVPTVGTTSARSVGRPELTAWAAMLPEAPRRRERICKGFAIRVLSDFGEDLYWNGHVLDEAIEEMPEAVQRGFRIAATLDHEPPYTRPLECPCQPGGDQ